MGGPAVSGPPGAGAPAFRRGGRFRDPALAERARLGRLLYGAGFSNAQIEDVWFVCRFAATGDQRRFLLAAAGAIAMVLGWLGTDEGERVRVEIERQLVSFASTVGSRASCRWPRMRWSGEAEPRPQ